jgi:hypothetical protein
LANLDTERDCHPLACRSGSQSPDQCPLQPKVKLNYTYFSSFFPENYNTDNYILQNYKTYDIYNAGEKDKTMLTGTAVNKIKKIRDFLTCVKRRVGSGSVSVSDSKSKVGSGSAST